MSRFRRLMVIFFCCFFVAVLLVSPVDAAVKVGRVKGVTKWKLYKVSTVADGMTYQFKWKKVKGADGYQVKCWELTSYNGWGSGYTKTTKKTRFRTSFSDADGLKAKVRAYKIVKGKKKYGKWSKMVKTVF